MRGAARATAPHLRDDDSKSLMEAMLIISLLLTAAQAAGVESDEIVITASRAPQPASQTAASVTVIDDRRLERLGEPLVHSLIRLTPSAAVETGGPAGSLAQVRIRGGEANHTLLFIDGIRANDPAAGGIPRFELLNADIASRLELIRGPQSALWGSDAIGGIVAVNGLAPERNRVSALAEAGSFGFARAGASAAFVGANASLAAAGGWQRASGIDSFDGTGDRDGYRNLSARLRAGWSPAPNVEVGAAGFALSGDGEFDGFNPLTFRRDDTLDSARNRLAAGRLWVSAGDRDDGTSGTIATSLLGSSNRNLLAGEETNRTRGERWTASAQLHHRFSTGAVRHSAIVALDHDREQFRARDTVYFGASNQDRRRTHDAVTAEWGAELAPFIADLAVRRDRFSAFADATTVRASALAALGKNWSVAGSYSEGIAQPTFFDLYGFFPGMFIGNPDLSPERSRGFEASVRFRRQSLEAAMTIYRQVLRDEIVDIFDPATFQSSAANRNETSRRRGLEIEAAWAVGGALRLTGNYALLDAEEPGAVPGSQVREIRRPRHSGSIAIDGERGRFAYGASLAYVGARGDTDFEVFPARRVRLDPYWLASARLAVELRPGLALFARASNLFDQGYQDVFGYQTEGRALYAGIRAGR